MSVADHLRAVRCARGDCTCEGAVGVLQSAGFPLQLLFASPSRLFNPRHRQTLPVVLQARAAGKGGERWRREAQVLDWVMVTRCVLHSGFPLRVEGFGKKGQHRA